MGGEIDWVDEWMDGVRWDLDEIPWKPWEKSLCVAKGCEIGGWLVVMRMGGPEDP